MAIYTTDSPPASIAQFGAEASLLCQRDQGGESTMDELEDNQEQELQLEARNVRNSLLYEFWKQARSKPRNPSGEFVHYTDFNGFSGIIESRSLWFSSVRDMNDTSELSEGKHLIFDHSQPTKILNKNFRAVEAVDPHLYERIQEDFNSRFFGDEANTFVSCWSDLNPNERDHDKLSMWRGYGNNGKGVAISIKLDELVSLPHMQDQIALVPVFYADETSFLDRAKTCLSAFNTELTSMEKDIRLRQTETIILAFQDLCFFLAITHKNKGFEEENEWRLIWQRNRSPFVLDGFVNQHPELRERFHLPICKSMSKDEVDHFIIPLESLMIGPCEHQSRVSQVAVNLLQRYDYSYPTFLVDRSDIPYRPRL